MDTAVGDLLTVEEVARTLRCGRDKVIELAEAGQLEMLQFGRRSKRITERSLQKLINDAVDARKGRT